MCDEEQNVRTVKKFHISFNNNKLIIIIIIMATQ